MVDDSSKYSAHELKDWNEVRDGFNENVSALPWSKMIDETWI